MEEKGGTVSCQLLNVISHSPLVSSGGNGQQMIQYKVVCDPKDTNIKFSVGESHDVKKNKISSEGTNGSYLIAMPVTFPNTSYTLTNGKSVVTITEEKYIDSTRELETNNRKLSVDETSDIVKNKISSEGSNGMYLIAMPIIFPNTLYTQSNGFLPSVGKSVIGPITKKNIVPTAEVKSVGNPITELSKKAVTTLQKLLVDDNPLTCKVCSKTFVARRNLTVHLRSHSGEKPCKCKICGKGFAADSGLRAHKKTHTTEKPFLCEICGKKFQRKGNLNTHLASHSEEKPFTCSFCNKSFSTGNAMSQHEKLHTNIEQKRTCEKCGKSFRRSLYLPHLKTHEGEKLFVCTFCDKKFLWRGQLKKHLRIHTGERPYPCNICEKSFSLLEGKKLHMRQHTNEEPYSCPECSRTFKSRSNMRTHMHTHFGIKPYSCKLCKKRFTQAHSLKKHMVDKVCLK